MKRFLCALIGVLMSSPALLASGPNSAAPFAPPGMSPWVAPGVGPQAWQRLPMRVPMQRRYVDPRASAFQPARRMAWGAPPAWGQRHAYKQPPQARLQPRRWGAPVAYAPVARTAMAPWQRPLAAAYRPQMQQRAAAPARALPRFAPPQYARYPMPPMRTWQVPARAGYAAAVRPYPPVAYRDPRYAAPVRTWGHQPKHPMVSRYAPAASPRATARRFDGGALAYALP